MRDPRDSSGMFWMTGGVLLFVLCAAAVVPVVECHECGPYFRPFLDASGRVMPGRPTGAVPMTCPMCNGAEKVSMFRRWTRPREGWYPVYFQTIQGPSRRGS